MVGEDLVGDRGTGDEPGDDAVPPTGVRRSAPAFPPPARLANAVWMFIAPRFAKLPVTR